MHTRFPSEARNEDYDSQFTPSQGYLGMLYGENDTDEVGSHPTETEPPQQDTPQEEETRPPPKKRAKVTKPKGKTKKKAGSTSKAKSTNNEESDDEEEGTKRGPNWKEHWIINLIHLRGTMHDKFSGMKKQGVDSWGVLHTHLVAACPNFDRSSDACRKKWKKIYDDYKSDYTANGISGNDRSSKCKWYSTIDGYMHDRANVYKHVHASAQDEDPNNVQEDSQDTPVPGAKDTVPTPSSSQNPSPKKSEKVATQEVIAQMAEHSKSLADAVKESEAGKLLLLQGMLATMNDFVKKL